MSDSAMDSTVLEKIRPLLHEAVRDNRPIEQLLKEMDDLIAGTDFNETVRAAWVSAPNCFSTEHLLSGLVVAYGSAVKDGVA